MTQDFSWNKTIGMINGYQATKISQVGKDGKTIKSDTYIDFNNDGINDVKVLQQGGKTSVFTAAAENGKACPHGRGRRAAACLHPGVCRHRAGGLPEKPQPQPAIEGHRCRVQLQLRRKGQGRCKSDPCHGRRTWLPGGNHGRRAGWR